MKTLKRKLQIIFALTFLMIANVNCGEIRLTSDNSEKASCEPLDPSELVIHDRVTDSENLLLNLVRENIQTSFVQAFDAKWTIRREDETGEILSESDTLTSEHNFNFADISVCQVHVKAEYQSCDQAHSVEKIVQLSACEVTTTTTTSTTTSTTTTTSSTTTTTLRVGIEAPGCQPLNPALQMTVSWDNIFNRYGTNPWPGFGSRRRFSNLGVGVTTSFHFTTPSTLVIVPGRNPGFGTEATADYPGDGDGVMKMTISESEGCTDVAKLDPRCVSIGRYAGVGWSFIPSPYSCPLELGKTYYINMTYGNSTTGSMTEPHCPGTAASPGVCGVDMQNQIQ